MTSESIIEVEGRKVRGLMSKEQVVSEGEAGQDDSAVIQAVIDQAENDSAIIFSGRFAPTKQIVISKNLSFAGYDADFTWDVTGTDLFLCSGAPKTTTLLTKDANRGDTTISLNPATISDLLIISDNTLWNPPASATWKKGESHKFKSLSGDSITITDPIENNYSVASGATCSFIAPISVKFDGMSIDSPDGTADIRGFQLKYCIDSSLTNCRLDGLGLRSISIDDSFGVSIRNNTISNSMREGYGYGVVISNAASNILVERNTISKCRHTIAHSGNNKVGQPRQSHINRNHLAGSSINNTLDAHPVVLSLEITNNRITNEKASNAGINIGAKRAVISGNKISNCVCISPRGNLKNCLWDIEDNIFETVSFGFYAKGTDGTTWDTVIFRENRVEGTGCLLKITDPNPISNLISSKTSDRWYDKKRSNSGKVDRIRKLRKK